MRNEVALSSGRRVQRRLHITRAQESVELAGSAKQRGDLVIIAKIVEQATRRKPLATPLRLLVRAENPLRQRPFGGTHPPAMTGAKADVRAHTQALGGKLLRDETQCV